MELQDVQSLPPRYRQPTHFAAIAEDISVIIVEIMEMVSFEHGKEIEKDVFLSCVRQGENSGSP